MMRYKSSAGANQQVGQVGQLTNCANMTIYLSTRTTMLTYTHIYVILVFCL